MNDLTIIYTTANKIPVGFAVKMQEYLLDAIGGMPIITVAKELDGLLPRLKEEVLLFATPSSHINIYRETLEGVRKAKTKYVAIAEDDVLYSREHFLYRPKKQAFAYNANAWSIYTWVQPAVFSYKGMRRNHCYLICERGLYIETLEERFNKYRGITDDQIPLHTFAEPGRYEGNLGLTIRETEIFDVNPPNIMFSHETGLSFAGLGKRKRLGAVRATEIPHWGRAEDILKLYA